MVAAAVKAIDEGGEQAIRTKAIAEAAGVTEPSVFHFFGNREGLVQAAQIERYKRSLAEMYAAFRDAVARCSSKDEFSGIVRATITMAFTPHRDKERSSRVSVLGSAVSRPTMRAELVAAQDASFAALTEALDRARAEGWLDRDVDGRVFAAWLAGTSTGRVIAELYEDPEMLQKWNEMTVSSVLHLFGIE